MNLLGRIGSAFRAQDTGDGMTASDLTISQLLDYINGAGDSDITNLYGVSPFGTRNAALSFPAFFSAITLISSMIAQITTTGSLRIKDRDNKVVKTGRAQAALDLFESTLDGVFPSWNTMEDLAVDYLVDGNGLAHIDRSTRGDLRGLRRLSSWDADTTDTSSGDPVYRARYAEDPHDARKQLFAARDVIHIKWPRLIRSNVGGRRFFAPSPVILMRTALEIGLLGDTYIRGWYEDGGGAHRSNIGIALRERLTPEQTKQLNDLFAQTTKKRSPLVVGGGASFSNLAQSASSSDQADLRNFQVSEFGRIYRIPGPLLNQDVTQWGSGIEQLAKFFWRFGLRQHTERLLAALSLRTLPSGQRYSIDDTDLLRGDSASISTLLMATGSPSGGEIATTEERRLWAGLPLEPEYGELKEPEPPAPPPGADGPPPGEEEPPPDEEGDDEDE